MDQHTDDLVRKVAAEVATKVADEMEHRLNVHFDRTTDLITRAAEGYGATLGSIDRRLKRLEKKWDTKISDHDRVLANHNQRISNIEQKRR